MKKISFFALLVLTGVFFMAPALQAQDAAAAAAPEAQEAQAPETENAEAQKKAKALTVAEDDDQTGNFMGSSLDEILGAFFAQFDNGDGFDTGNPVITTSHVEENEDYDDDDDDDSLSAGSSL